MTKLSSTIATAGLVGGLAVFGIASGATSASAADNQKGGTQSKPIAQDPGAQGTGTQGTGTQGTGTQGTGTQGTGTQGTGTQGTGTGAGTQGTEPGSPGTGTQGTAPGGERAAPVEQVAEVISATATIENIDKKNRKLSLKDSSGARMEVQVPSDVAGFDRLKKGDKIDLTYYESVAVSLMPAGAAGAAAPVMEERVVGTRRLAGGVMAREISVAIPVTNVDANKGTVTFKGPEGQTRTVKVEDARMKERLRDLKAGDVVNVTYTEAVATAILPPQKKGQQQQQQQPPM